MVTKKTTKKVVKKVTNTKPKKAVKDSGSAQDGAYWLKRPLLDTERDWGYGEENWVKDYVKSKDHPHRQIVLDLLHNIEWSYLLEIGCSTGPNLALIREAYPDKALFGLEINQDSVNEAWKTLPSNIDVKQGDYAKIPYPDHYFDVVLADAVLMYTDPEHINAVMDELDRVTQKAILIVDRYTEEDSTESHVWSRNYTKLLANRGYQVGVFPVTEAIWPTSKNWQKYGKFFFAVK